ncbi:TPA: hypothetical protein NJ444_002734 [Vibrio parahaemolyticus]|nr:hypothetical protein [Vibrio parahaemolyticus]
MEILSVLATLGAVLMGYWLGNRDSIKQVKKQRNNFYTELEILEEDLTSWLRNGLVDEYKKPQRCDYTYPLDVDWDFLNSIQLELGAEMLPEHRKLIKRIKSYHESIISNTERRNKKATGPNGEVQYVDYKLTAQVIVQVNQMLYFLAKCLSERDNFTVSTGYNMFDAMESVNRAHAIWESNSEINEVLNNAGYAKA